MGQHKLGMGSHGQKPTTHKPSLKQFNESWRGKLVHVSAEIIDNPLKPKMLAEYEIATQRAEHLANMGDRDGANEAVHLARVLKFKHDNAPDRIVGKRKTFAIGANQAKQYRKIIKATAKRDRRTARRA